MMSQFTPIALKDYPEINRTVTRREYERLVDYALEIGITNAFIPVSYTHLDVYKRQHAHSFIRRLPKGYDTEIGEDGGSLSQGQKQLLCITRVTVSYTHLTVRWLHGHQPMFPEWSFTRCAR